MVRRLLRSLLAIAIAAAPYLQTTGELAQDAAPRGNPPAQNALPHLAADHATPGLPGIAGRAGEQPAQGAEARRLAHVLSLALVDSAGSAWFRGHHACDLCAGSIFSNAGGATLQACRVRLQI